MYQYREISTNETVLEEETKDYVLDRLGLTVTPKGKNGEMTLEQLENVEETVDWFFSGNWIKEEIEEDVEIVDDLEWADIIYQENLDKRMEAWNERNNI